MGQIQTEEIEPLLLPTDYHIGLTEVSLSMTSRMCKGHKHLTRSLFAFANIIFNDSVTAIKSMLFTQPIKHALGGMTLLAMNGLIRFQPSVNDRDEGTQLWLDYRFVALITRRDRVTIHLAYRLTRDTKLKRTFTLALASSTCQTNFPIQIHSINLQVLHQKNASASVKDISGRLLHRPQQNNSAATVVYFCTAVYSSSCA